jgi:acetyltransferase
MPTSCTVEQVDWSGRPLTLRPVRPEYGPRYGTFFECLNDEDVRFRKFMLVRELAPSQTARQTQIDYDREMSFVAIATGENGETEMLGVAQAIADPDNLQAEFAVVVRSDLRTRPRLAAVDQALRLPPQSRHRTSRRRDARRQPPHSRPAAPARAFDVTGATTPLRSRLRWRVPRQASMLHQSRSPVR